MGAWEAFSIGEMSETFTFSTVFAFALNDSDSVRLETQACEFFPLSSYSDNLLILILGHFRMDLQAVVDWIFPYGINGLVSDLPTLARAT
jgi:hypothetical protein